MDKFKALFKSRKFYAALVAFAMIALSAFIPDFPLTDEQVTEVVYVLMAYIVGVGLDDGLRRLK